MSRVVIYTAIAGIALTGAFAVTASADRKVAPKPVLAVASPAAVRTVPAGCTVPAPASAAGFTALFASVPTSQWGAADVSISVPLGAGRSVWLYGDTFSEGRFVHSTAITQDKGCLHVSNHGAQLLPNDNATHIYWIESVRAVSSSRLAIVARSVHLLGQGVWAFEDGGFSRTATADVTKLGDVVFRSWGPKVAEPAPDPGPLYALDNRPHHFGYARHTHPWARLASGRTLTTVCQNWDDGVLHPFPDYRPLFSES